MRCLAEGRAVNLSVADRLEIRELISRYNRAVDGGDPEAWADTFTPDGVFESLLVGTFRGRDELLAFAREFGRDSRYSQWTGGQHWIGNLIIEGDTDRAEVFSYHLMFVPEEATVRGVLMAAHEDIVVRSEPGWRFERRKLVPWPPDSDPGRWDRARTGDR